MAQLEDATRTARMEDGRRDLNPDSWPASSSAGRARRLPL